MAVLMRVFSSIHLGLNDGKLGLNLGGKNGNLGGKKGGKNGNLGGKNGGKNGGVYTAAQDSTNDNAD